MLGSLINVRKDVEAKIKTREYRNDENDRVVIPITVQDDTDFLSVFGENENPLISTDVAEYLEEKTVGLPVNKQWNLQIFSNCIDPDEQEAYRKGIREYYLVQYIANKKELHRNTMVSVILLAVGMIALLFTLMIDTVYGNLFWAEIVDIVAWVFVWESVDVSVFRNHELRVKRIQCLKFMEMSMEFLPVKRKEVEPENGK